MHQIYFLVRIFPYWSVPLALVLGQLALHFRRRKSTLQLPLLGMIFFLVMGTGAWIFYRGDLHSDDWVRWFFTRDI